MEALIEARLWQVCTCRRRVLSVPWRQGAGSRSERLRKNVVKLELRIRLPDPACSTLGLSQTELCSPPANNFGGTISFGTEGASLFEVFRFNPAPATGQSMSDMERIGLDLKTGFSARACQHCKLLSCHSSCQHQTPVS